MQTELRSHPEVHSRPDAPGQGAAAQSGSLSWTVVGAVAGGLGALVVAVFFLIVDLALRQALWTPTALGAALFLGQRIAEDAAPSTVLVVGYTGVHAAAFLSVGMMAAFAFVQRREPPGALGGLLLAVIFFGVFELLILGFLRLAAPGLVGTFGALTISTANLLASVAMATFLTHLAPRLESP